LYDNETLKGELRITGMKKNGMGIYGTMGMGTSTSKQNIIIPGV
jgi:hypothetical protein